MNKDKVYVRNINELHIIQYDEKTREIIYSSRIGGRKFKAVLKDLYGDIIEITKIQPIKE